MKVYKGNINSLSSLDYVFVFGSNTAGRHGGGAARWAMDRFGAEMGNARGRQGQSYAIPTCTADIQLLPLEYIQKEVDTFLADVRANPEKIYFLTPIGTGIAGGKVSDMASLFWLARDMDNLIFPELFVAYLVSPGEDIVYVDPNA